MNKYKLIVADVTNPTYSKMSAVVAQHLAVSFGYPLLNLKVRDDQVLVFNPNTKAVSVHLRDEISKYEATMAFTADYLVGSMENPTVDCTTIEDGKVSATIFENAVTFRSSTSRLIGHATVPKDFILRVASRLGDNADKSLPTVSFHYPDSRQSYAHLYRVVRVTKMDNEFIWGFEMKRGDTEFPPEGVFKKYSCRRVQGHVDLLDFRS